MNENRQTSTSPLHTEITSQEAITSYALAADDLLDQAFDWLCKRRKDWPPNADVWRFRRDWLAEKAQIQTDLMAVTYEIGVLDRVILFKDGQPEEVDLSVRPNICTETVTEL